MDFYFEYKKSQVLNGLRYHFIQKKEIKITVLLVNAYVTGSCGLLYFGKINGTSFFISSLVWALVCGSFWFVLPWTIYRKSKTFSNRFRIQLTHERVVLDSEGQSVQWDWSDFSFYRENLFFFFLYFNAETFFMIPKPAPPQAADLAMLLKEKLLRK